jgi:hypothetical protein
LGICPAASLQWSALSVCYFLSKAEGLPREKYCHRNDCLFFDELFYILAVAVILIVSGKSIFKSTEI